MADHATLAPSKAQRWAGQCSGSVALEAQFVNAEKSQEQLDGDAAHWVAATVLRAHRDGVIESARVSVGNTTPNGVVIDDEMLEAVEVFVADVLRVVGHDVKRLNIEDRVTATQIHPDNWGTPDVWYLDETGTKLFVWDLKYGHRFVDAFENWQLIDYAAGVLENSIFEGCEPSFLHIVLSIVQPRNFHQLGPIRRWATTAAKLVPYFAQLSQSAATALSPAAATVVGPECRDCSARHACMALQAAGDNAMDIASGTVVLELGPTAIGVELRMLRRAATLLQSRITGLEAQALAMLRAGQAVPFFKIEQGQGRETWTKDAAEVFALGDALDIDLRKAITPITPAQARKAGLDADIVKAYAERPKGALQIVAVETKDVKRIFAA